MLARNYQAMPRKYRTIIEKGQSVFIFENDNGRYLAAHNLAEHAGFHRIQRVLEAMATWNRPPTAGGLRVTDSPQEHYWCTRSSSAPAVAPAPGQVVSPKTEQTERRVFSCE